ncbi:contactin [Plakobranchus ocellatus]|uniref:Contactin n=1 Tax=Plakobranchus ocellatus TaxID=259542 RepID=A0AAV4DLV3_9GAST|nr:contactin [Plakobranchus ocellatus]
MCRPTEAYPRNRNATMKLGIVFVLTVIIEWTYAQQKCPSNLGWYKSKNNCYRFETFPRLVPSKAGAVCEQDGAHLLSVGFSSEHSFVKQWLLENDVRRIEWLTSGLTTSAGVKWQGDSTTSTTTYWVDNYASPNVTNLPVIYKYTGTEYGWNTGSDTTEYAFICEIPLNDVYKIVQEFRDFDYGADVENAKDAKRGPVFLQEPQNTIILGRVGHISLECLAEGNPEPTYEWEMRKNQQWVPVPTGGRFSFTTGRLDIRNPQSSDDNTYQCKAINSEGKAVSSSATLSFGELGDFPNTKPSRVVGAEYNGAQLECPPIKGNPAKTYQWYKNSATNFIRPNFQKHIFMSMNGKLYFSELATSDAGTYHCVVNLFSHGFGGQTVSVSSESRTSLGFDLVVSSGAGSRYQPIIQNGFPFVFPPSPVKGGEVRLECFAYGTGPLIYTWSREGDRPLPLGHTFDSSNRILSLKNVELQDGGVYKCHVMSTETRQEDEASTNLIIQARPYFTYPLSHMHLDVGSRLAWHCEAAGMPEPVYSWYKDGVRFTSDPSAGIVVNRNSLTIEKVDEDRDSAMYQCAAENQYGTSYSTAQLRVLEIKPRFDKSPMPESVSAAMDGQVTLRCNPVAAPAPTYRWLKDGVDLNLDPNIVEDETAHYQLLKNGNLMIRKITQSDQGEYICEATNSLGKAMDKTRLLVLEGTTISDPPADDEVEVNMTATLLCRASHSPEIDMIYVWSFNDHIIDYSIEPEYRQGEGNMKGSLYIVGAKFENEGVYTCTATTALDSYSRSAYLEVKGPPGEPAGVLVKTAAMIKAASPEPDNINDPGPNHDSTRWVVWVDGQTHGSDITHYFVEFRTEYDQRWRVHPDADNILSYKVVSEQFPDHKVAMLRNLKAYTGIQFRVRARNAFGIGNPSLPTELTQIAGTSVAVPVKNIRGGGGSVGDLTIVWDPLAKEDYNGPNLTYTVSWREFDATTNTQWRSKTVLEAQACKYRADYITSEVYPCDYVAYVGDQKYYMPYEVKVRARNNRGIGPDMEPVIVMSAEDLPIGTPEKVFGHLYNATALLITWKPVPNTRQSAHGRLKGYKINYWRKNYDTESGALQNIIELKPGQENIDRGLIIGLEPVKWYTFNVQAYNSAGNGDKSSDYERQTLNRPPSQYPTEVHVFSVEGFGIRVNFRGISTQIREEPLRGYKIPMKSAEQTRSNMQLTSKE